MFLHFSCRGFFGKIRMRDRKFSIYRPDKDETQENSGRFQSVSPYQSINIRLYCRNYRMRDVFLYGTSMYCMRAFSIILYISSIIVLILENSEFI